MAHDEQWLTPRLQTAATLCNQTPAATESPLWLGVDLGTCDVVSMVVDRDGQPVAVCLDWADVVRDGIVWDFFGAVTIVRRHLDTLEQQFGRRFSHAATSFPPGTDPRISINVLESRHLRIKFIDEQGRLFVDDEQQQPQPVHGLTSSDEHPQACCELCRQPVAKKPDTLTHLSAEKMVAKSDPRLGFRAVLDSTIALAVWLQIELAEPWQPWLADIRSRLGNIMRADALGEPLGCQAIVGLSDEDLHRLSHQPLRYLDHDHLVPEASHGRDAALLNLLRTKVRETETVAAQVFITRSFEVLRPDILQALNRLSSTVYVMMILSVTKQPLTVKQIQQRLGETQ